MGFTNLADLLKFRAYIQPDKTAFTFLQDGEIESVRLTYKELDELAQVIAYELQTLTTAGDRALMLYPSGLDFIAAFFGCLYAGVIAVPAYPPRRNQKMSRLEAITKDAQAKVILTTASLVDDIKGQFAGNSELIGCCCIPTDNLITREDFSPYQATPETIAFLQYTSGSTGTPKGVMVSHGNMLHNQQLIQAGFKHTEQSSFVGWLPLFHDMGLIGNILQPLYLGIPCTLMSPVAFLQRPLRWLQAISRYKATTSGGPNFAYDLCIRQISDEQKTHLDLSSWEVAFNGAEPVRAETLARFTDAFANCGFHREAFYPCYGMAETTLIISGGFKGIYPQIKSVQSADLEQNRIVENDREDICTQKLVSCGQPLQDVRVVIANPDSLTRCEPDRVGEIWVAGASVTQGYWNRSEETERTFSAYLTDPVEGPYLRTGDLGFLKDGELFITGRLKDLIIIRGRNHYPQDIEQTAEQSHPALQPSASVAFALSIAGEERLGIALEVKRSYLRSLNDSEVIGAIRQAIAENHQLPVYAVVLLKIGSLAKTSSGKIQRHTCRHRFLEASLDVVASSILEEDYLGEGEDSFTRETLLAITPELRQSQLEYYLQQQVGKILKLAPSQFNLEQPLSYLGFDSLTTIELKNNIQSNLGVVLPVTNFLNGGNITQLAAEILPQLTEHQASVSAIPAITPNLNQRYQPFPLTDIQQAYWVGRSAAFELGNIATHIYVEVDAVDLDIKRFNQAWQRLIERHEMLRTIILPDGQQQILKQVPSYEIKVLDLREQPQAVVNLELQAVRARLSHQVLSSAQFPLFEICATKLDNQHTRLHFSFDLLISDAWSFQIIGRELAKLYQNPETSLAPLEISFRDYVLAEINQRNSQQYQRAWDYWQNRIPNLALAPELPLAQNLSAIKNPRFLRRSGFLAANTWLKLKTYASQAGITPSGILLGAFAEVLTVWSKNPRFTLTLTLFNRLPLHPEVNQLIGDFTSLTLLEIDNSGQDAFVNRVKRLQAQLWEDLDHRDVNGVQVLRELGRTQGRLSSALMPVVFTSTLMQNAEQNFPLHWLGESVYSITQTSQVFLDHQVAEAAGALIFNWDAVEDVFPAGLLDDMFAAYCKLLESLANQLEWQETHPRLISHTQLEQRATINATDALVSPELLHTLFTAQVPKYAEKTAVFTTNRTLSYKELYQRSQQLGYQLRQLGAKPNQLIAVVMEKGWEQVVSVLGILAAGAAYVPIDPRLPAQRRSHLLNQAEVQLVVTQSWIDSNIDWSDNIQRICVDIDVVANNIPTLEPLQQPEDIAYVIYTSGSTGLPKGVVIDHRGAVNTILDINQRFNVQSSDRVFALSALSFDLSVYDIFGTLAAGGTIVIPNAAATQEPAHWMQLMQSEQITIWNSVPALMQMMVDCGVNNAAIFQSLRLVMLSGDWLSLTLPNQIKALAPQIEVISLGGATEASIWSILYPITEVNPNWKSIPYGKPMKNQRFYILNEALEHCPVWVPGQLYIGGIGLAKGYWRDELKTAASFITHPHTGERLYRTGDLGCYLPDGNIEFLGREDFQVKIGGYRIELGEIEAVLNQHPEVQATTVIVREDIPGDKRLVAYFVSNSQPASTDKILRQFLKQQLPEYMVPVDFVPLEALPLTPNGKVERRALPVPDRTRNQLENHFTAPRTPTEVSIAQIWAQILGLQEVGIHDNFFELGGHSLLAIQIMSRIRETFEIDLPLSVLFETPTIAGLSQAITFAQETQTPERAKIPPAIVPVPRNVSIPLSFSQYEIWYLEHETAGVCAGNSPLALQVTGALSPVVLEQSFNEIIRRHEILRTTFSTVEEQLIQKISPFLTISLEVIDLQHLPLQTRELEAQKILHKVMSHRFDLTIAPLIKIVLVQLSPEEHWLLILMHHIITDGWSYNVLLEELTTLYDAFLAGKPSPLPDLPFQYADFAIWQRNYFNEEVLANHLPYWQQHLASLPTSLDLLPATETSQDSSGDPTYHVALPQDLTNAIASFSQSYSVTPFIVLLTALNILLYKWSDQTDILVLSTMANRLTPEIEKLLGCFIGELPLRTRLDQNQAGISLLEQVKQTVSAALSHAIPVERIWKPVWDKIEVLRTVNLVLVPSMQWSSQTLTCDVLSITSYREVWNEQFVPLELYVSYPQEKTQPIEFFASYSTATFTPKAIDRFISNYQAILQKLVEQPEQQISEFGIVIVNR